jgi:hypothetical protein
MQKLVLCSGRMQVVVQEPVRNPVNSLEGARRRDAPSRSPAMTSINDRIAFRV